MTNLNVLFSLPSFSNVTLSTSISHTGPPPHRYHKWTNLVKL